ncbi:IQ domain-containing protein E isoform X11 [Suricata suricatta]|uniref:IQ motif containing E n=1 Tax=Suricata suricatta TaxID=37032 RepID=A0A673THA4_SURSU|nr:IQ domain-containing protein E isoform X11 [Suricata suricatta]
MSLGTAEPASETGLNLSELTQKVFSRETTSWHRHQGDDSLSAITFDSEFEMKAKRKSFHKPPPTSPKSPYHSKPRKVASWRSLRTAASMPLGNRVSLTPQKLWPGSSKQGSLTQPLKSDLTLEHAWASPPSTTPDYLAAALRVKRSNLRRSASHGHVPRTPIYREKEDMYDEIIELKKVINGLKQRILRLEQQCKEKDNTINKLQTDMKTTNLEEMRIAMETYYEEIQRLQTLLASSETTGKKTPGEKKTSLRKQKRVSSALLSLSRSIQELTEENQSLKEDLDRVLSNSPAISAIKVPSGPVEWSQARLPRRTSELEKKINLMEGPKSQTSEADKSSGLVQSASSSAVPRPPRCDQQQESEHLRETVQSLRGERNALQVQLQAKDLEVRKLLQANADLQKELENVKDGEEERRGREEALREEIQTLIRKFRELEEIKRQEKDDPMEMTLETPEEPSLPTGRSCQQDSKPGMSEKGSSWPPSTCSEGRRDTAARVLQSRWRTYRNQRKRAILDEVAMVLQAAFRGHVARAKLLSSQACSSGSPGPPHQDPPSPHFPSPTIQAEGSPGQEEAITAIQSVLRAHLVWLSAASQRTITTASRRRGPPPATHSQLSSPPWPATSPGPENSEGSSGEATQGPSAEAEAPEKPVALRLHSGLSSPSGPGPADDGSSDDSDEIVVAPAVAAGKTASPP